MWPRSLGLAVTLILLVTEMAQAQYPFPPGPLLPPPPGPLMYVRFAGPKGAKISVYRGIDGGQTLELPRTLGFRPGYSYRLAVFDIPNMPRQIFCPSLEVRGTLALASKLRNAEFPVQINFTEAEFRRVLGGTFVKKVITLERPDLAIPIASRPDEPLEVAVQASRDPMIEAAQRGQPLVVYQLGERFLTPQELNGLAIPGTVLLPGDRGLGAPRYPPYLIWKWCPVYDPVHGPRHPAEFNAIYDGGDSGPQAGFNRDGKLKGLDPTDTVAEYMDSKGNKRLAISNRVALCVPRFIIFTGEYMLAMQTARSSVQANLKIAAPIASVGQLALKDQSQQLRPEMLGTKLRMGSLFNSMGTSVTGRARGVEIKSTLRSPASVDHATAPKPLEPLDGPLVIIKWPDKECAIVGDIVTFYLKYCNTGGQPITNVVVSDNLTPRLEYVMGSAKADRDASFTTQPNDVGSTILRWEFPGTLQPREHGLVSFQVRVR